MHPFREDGSEIEGLYMAGDCSGGFFSTSYPNLFTGLACGRTVVEPSRRHASGDRQGRSSRAWLKPSGAAPLEPFASCLRSEGVSPVCGLRIVRPAFKSPRRDGRPLRLLPSRAR